MSAQRTFIVSDLHLGCEYFHRAPFLSWLEELPSGARLVLNGDIVDDPEAPLSSEHRAVLERLIEESYRRPLVWVYGNHDEGVELEDCGRIEFVDRWALGRRLLVLHGAELDAVMPRHEFFKVLFKRVHRLRIRLGFPDVHVAQYAKKWNLFYRVFNEHVARRALRAAAEQGFEAVTCGHTHAAMRVEDRGCRYFNTGAWTEEPLHYLAVDEESIGLHIYGNGKG